MRISKFFGLGAIFCFAFTAASAQQIDSPSAPPTTSDPQAVALIQRSLAAFTGGMPVTDVTLSGTARRIAGSEDETGTVTLKATSLGDSRVDLSFPSGNRSEIRNHSAIPLSDTLPANPPAGKAQVGETPQPSGLWTGPDGTTHGIPNHNLMTDATWFVPAITLNAILSATDCVISYVGLEMHDGQPLVHVSASRPTQLVDAPQEILTLTEHLSHMDIYVDPSTSIPVVLAFYIHPDADAMVDFPTEVRFSNYRFVAGVQTPFHVQKYVNGSLLLDLQLTSASLNSGLSSQVFTIQ
jgi:hypothetical protein